MRIKFLRWSTPLLIALSAAMCGSAPTEPTENATTAINQSPAAQVHATGTLKTVECSPDGKCSLQGAVTNDGPDCASNVRGVTHLFDASGKEIATQSWEILGRVRRGDTTYTVGFSQAAVNSYRTYRTDVSFEPLLCI